MAEKGLDGVAINEITEAADVGFGSFYNYFESKEAIYQALVDSVFEEFGIGSTGCLRTFTIPLRSSRLQCAIRYRALKTNPYGDSF
jgi:AcrR family transcriptional regulator